MEERRFDELTRVIARSTSRRRLLKGAVAAITGGVLSSLGLSAQAKNNQSVDDFCGSGQGRGVGSVDAVRFCKAVFHSGPQFAKCVVDAAHDTGLYCDCHGDPGNVCNGPAGAVCPDFSGDANNCGTCGNECPDGQPCLDGSCGCSAGQTPCNGTCVDSCDALTGEDVDPETCQCVCPTGQSLCGGVCAGNCDPATGEVLDPTNCQCVCPSEQELCGGTCIDLCDPATGEVHNSETCQCECPSNKVMCNETCVPKCDEYDGQVLDTATCQCVCPDGYIMLETGFCLQSCTQDSDCGDYRTCDTTTEGERVCSTGGYLPFCSPCTSSAGCQSGPGSCQAVNAYCSANDHLCH